MVLEGLGVATWSGWLTGLLFLRAPWGLPTTRSLWKEPYLFYHFAIGSLNILLWSDYLFHFNETFKNQNPLEKFIGKLFTYMFLLNFFYHRIFFFFKSKGIAALLAQIENHPIYAKNIQKHKGTYRFFPVSFSDKLVLYFSFIAYIIGALVFSIAVGRQRDRKNSWFSTLPHIEYVLIFFFGGTLPLSVSTLTGFSYVLVVTRHLLGIFSAFCTDFETKMRNKSIPCIQITDFNRVNGKNVREVSYIDMMNYRKNKIFGTDEGLMSDFERILHLFELYNKNVGPFLLGLILVQIIYLVQTLNAILITNLSTLFLIFDWMTLLYFIFQLVFILFLGHWANKLIVSRKLKLRKILANIEISPEKRNTFKNLLRLMESWKWKMSAWGFFTIDRTLMPAVLSIMLSYLVVLFQVQLNSK